MRMRRERC
jgi:hypothetical protein